MNITMRCIHVDSHAAILIATASPVLWPQDRAGCWPYANPPQQPNGDLRLTAAPGRDVVEGHTYEIAVTRVYGHADTNAVAAAWRLKRVILDEMGTCWCFTHEDGSHLTLQDTVCNDAHLWIINAPWRVSISQGTP